ncbi:DUF423 domain-containing protein [Marinomonas sp. M1K-6]|uniref:DUF423 domain-containing protein n=2 Tax=Marinomonas profundi TaxID=2726122 RepID=A0A847RA85_9GAMM|nr:DUF423 domain-containing protein [Marinomonas profundi]UDV04827.1 DUF423 domain-containing protein [Marinomonas profundi]
MAKKPSSFSSSQPSSPLSCSSSAKKSSPRWAAVFAAQAFISVAAGAFGAHALVDVLGLNALAWWQTASQYLMYHALGGLIVAALFAYLPASKCILVLFFVGNLLFAGSLYVMALTGYTLLGMMTPLGGLCYLLAWGWLVWQLWQRLSEDT